MNKQNKILLGMLAFIVACTIGYALFSESINITGTATAKGDFNLTTTCQPGFISGGSLSIPDVLEPLGLVGIGPKEGGYHNDSCSVVDDKVTINTVFKYPSAMRMFTIKITNSGSIPVKIVDFSETSKHYVNDVLQEGPTGNYKTSFIFLGVYNLDGTMANQETFILKYNESAYVYYLSFWDSADTNNDNLERKTIGNVELMFEQVTAD